MNDSIDYTSLFQKNVMKLRSYLQDARPISDERLFARRNYEELLKNLNRKAQATGCDPEMIEPEFPVLFKAFVQQNIEVEAYLRKAERVREYERGRTEMQAAVQFGAVPDSFQQPFPTPFTPPTQLHPAASSTRAAGYPDQHILKTGRQKARLTSICSLDKSSHPTPPRLCQIIT